MNYTVHFTTRKEGAIGIFNAARRYTVEAETVDLACEKARQQLYADKLESDGSINVYDEQGNRLRGMGIKAR